jgi:choline dehydrogenase-like flavoprotein
LLEKGDELPRDGSTLDVAQVIRAGRFKSHEDWLDGNGHHFMPEEYFNVGGKTMWYGAAVLRYGAHEFEADAAHQCLPWPIRYSEIEPWYERAERLLGVHEFPVEPDLARIERQLTRRPGGWRSKPLPLALSPDIVNDRNEAAHFDAFASVRGYKADAVRVFLDPIRTAGNFELRSGDPVTRLVPDTADARRIDAVITASGARYSGRQVLLAAGALHSPRLLQDFLADSGLQHRLPAAQHVGRFYKQHLLTALVGFSPRRKTDLLRKTRILLHDALPHSSVQPLGFDAELIGALMPALLPRALATAMGQYAYGFFLQTEDGSHPDNRVLAGHDATPPRLDYSAQRLTAARTEHRRLVRTLTTSLLRAGMLGFSKTWSWARTRRRRWWMPAGACTACTTCTW